MAEGLSFTAKGIVAIVIVVILIVFYGRAPGIVQAATETVDRNLEAVGINIIDIPKILSLTPRVEPDGSVTVTWKLNRDGQKIEDQYFKAVFSYKKYPDDPINDVCTVKHIDKSTPDPKSVPKPDWTCSVDNGKSTAILKREGCTGPDCLDKLAGLYKIDVSFEKKEGYTTRKDEMETDPPFAFYTEKYVELLDRPLLGCYDGWGNCNVAWCKKLLVNYNLAGGAQGGLPTYLGLRKNLVVDVSNDFKVKPRSAQCGDVKSVGPLNYFNVDSCTKEEIDELNKMVARIRLLETANSAEYNLKSEDDYKNYLNQLDFWKKTAVKYTMSCTKSLGRVITTDPKGAEGELAKFGWQRAGDFKREAEVRSELDRVLKEKVKPAIVNLRAEALEGYKISLGWSLAKTPDGLVLGEERVKKGSYKISHFRTRWAGAITTENQKTERPKSPYSMKGEGSGGIIVTSFATDAGELTGKHEFEVKILDGGSNELAIAKASTGMFDDSYIETYKGGIDGCVTKGLGKDPKGLHECNVYGQKREELKALATPAGDKQKERVKEAQSKSSVKPSCKYEIVNEAGDLFIPHYAFNGCEPEELDRIWKNYLISLGSADDYDCILPLRSDAKNVCIIKRQVVNTLTAKGWKELRVKKGWENDV
ncbi:hypothetical protein HYY73_00335 [Candidatus Woesearchaeota archaeon]|nr:hypothetical protein [Candidatus Woesearchaeota archaeon]